jgi:hypothetical protein
MKKIILLASLAFSINAFAQVPSYIPTNGLVGWWPFSGNANDQSLNANNGNVNGASLTVDRFGNTNAAYNFNGTTSYIEIPNNSVFDLQDSLTFSIWINTTDVNLGQRILDKSTGGTSNGWLLDLSPNPSDSNKIRCIVGGATSNIPYSNPMISLNNTWYFITVTYDRQNVKFYVNGLLNNTVPLATITPTTSHPVRIGVSTSLGAGFFNGKLDDIGIWNRALTPQEINNLYNGNLCYQYITVTDTLLISTNITGFNPITYQNTIKIWPNPTNDHITIDNGNIANVSGYQIKITNSLSQQVFQSNITQQQFYVDLSTWTGNGIYFVHIIDGQGNTIDIRKIVLQ